MAPQKDSVEKMFNDISPKYDFLNHFLSFGIDFHWRNTVVKLLGTKTPVKILDVASGTGDLAIALTRLKPEKIVGIDIAEKMLEIARQKIRKKKLNDLIIFKQGDAENIPFSDASFDAVTVAFGVRNFENLTKGLAEMKRILSPGGTMIILEFSHPSSLFFRTLYRIYSTSLIPFAGRLISKHSQAYTYLPESVAAFPSGEEFLDYLRSLEMVNCTVIPLSFGIASIYYANKKL